MNSARIFSPSLFRPFVRDATLFVMASFVASSRGLHSSQYQRETSSQLFTVETISFCATEPNPGMSGSGNAWGTSLAIQVWRTLPPDSRSSGSLVTVPSSGWRSFTLAMGRSGGETISREACTIGRMASKTELAANASRILGLLILSRVTTRRISPTSMPGTAHVIFLSSGSYMFMAVYMLSVASFIVLRKSTSLTTPFVPVISIFSISASP